MEGNRIQLSERLQAVTAMVPRCGCVADVGCDHGYISIFLVQEGIARRAVAMDIRKGPLARAKEHIRQQQLASYIQVRLSDGLEQLAPREADVVVIAGMGGATMSRILTRGRRLLDSDVTLVLQPQSELSEFREFLAAEGYEITQEDMVWEDGKFYPMMQARPGMGVRRRYPAEQLAFGPLLLEQRHPALFRYLLWRQQQIGQILLRIQEFAGESVRRRRTEELEEELGTIRRGLAYYSGKGEYI